jgi:erythromycin esterase
MKYLLLLILCFTVSLTNAQKLIKDYVIKNNVAIRSIEPDSTDFSDLEVIGNAIGNAKVVMLGEQDHGDAPTFLAKTRLIKYLHEKKGFNVLAFESDFFALNDGWDKLKKTTPNIDTFIKKNIYLTWTACNTCSTLLYNYIPASYSNTKKPLVISGFDSQQYFSYTNKNFRLLFDSVLRSVNSPVTKQANYASKILPLLDSSWRWLLTPPKDAVEINTCLDYLHIIQPQLIATLDKDNIWLLVVDNMIQQVNDAKKVLLSGKPLVNSNERDVQMAKNLKWLNEVKFKDQKIIVWAADEHVVRSLKNMKESFFQSHASMGDSFVSNLNNADKVYVLGFASYTGTAGRIGTKNYTLYPPRKNSFETWINEKYKYAYVDFDGYNKIYPNADEYFNMTAINHLNYEGKWNNMFNGILFIRDMYPCEAVR